MRTLYFAIIPAVVLIAASCTRREVEQTAIQSGDTSLSAYFAETRTGYTIDESARKAVFSWLEGDRIDVAVNTGEAFVPATFATSDAGTTARFRDGLEGCPSLSGIRETHPGAELSDWAFYPSASDPLALEKGFCTEWSLEAGSQSVTLPASVDYVSSNPLVSIPLMGVRDIDGAYAFSPMTAVLAIPVSGLTEDMDFISVSSPDVALSGTFSLQTGEGCGRLLASAPESAADRTSTIRFSGLSGEHTFYFCIPEGTMPAGLTITCGSSSGTGGRLELTTSNPVTFTRGRILRCQKLSADWETVTTEGLFLDDFLWSCHSSFTAGTYVTVTIERSISDPATFRIANPYSVACSVFGYTPHTEGIEADPYLVFTIADDGKITFSPFRTGIEDKDSGGRAMTLNHPTSWSASRTGRESKVLWFSASDSTLPVSVQLGCVYADPDDSSYYYSRDGEGHTSSDRVHILFSDEPRPSDTWTSVGTGRYTDDFFWSYNSFPPMAVPVEIYRNDLDANSYRITNPYTVANTAFQRSGYDGDEYMYLTIDSSGSVSFDPLVTGMTLTLSGSVDDRNYAIKMPSDASATKLASGTVSNPLDIQMGAVYYDSSDATYYYTRATANLKHLYFPAYYEGETWTDFCEGTYTDIAYDNRINGSSAIGTVSVTIQQSTLDERRFRIANPYRDNVAASYLRPTCDDYLYFNTASSGLVFFETFRPGLAMNPSVSSAYELGIAHPASSNLLGYSQGGNYFGGSSVLSTLADGSPKKVQLGAHYYDIAGPTPGYCYTRQGSSWESERIFINFSVDDKATVSAYKIPMKAAFHNPVASLSLPSGTLEKLVVKIAGPDLSSVSGLRLWQSGWMDSGYVAPAADGTVTMTSFTKSTVSADIDLNFWVDDPDLSSSYTFDVTEVVVDGTSYPIEQDNTVRHLFGVLLNNGGDAVNVRGSSETVASFRIPALVTSTAGTLIAAYDVRYASSADLQADIDVGMKRSTDGGKTWSDLKIIMDMGEYGGLAQNQNGMGDPCLLVDENTGRIFCFSVWAHGHYNDSDKRCLAWAGTGFEIADTPQFMMVYSDDDGLTWCDPVNITSQVKKEDWRMTFQGPGRGITMKDGTLVVPIQHQEGDSKSMHNLYPLNSGIMYSTDHGTTWQAYEGYARAVTSESAVAEIEPGVLMLSMRDETNSHTRAVCTSSDLGRTWTAHSSDKTVIEPTCEASLLHVDAADNSLGQDLLLFSNPNSSSSRVNMTIQASLDKGVTWSHKLLLDSGGSLGYSCLTMVNNSTVGILYESSKGNILFQAVPLTDIIR